MFSIFNPYSQTTLKSFYCTVKCKLVRNDIFLKESWLFLYGRLLVLLYYLHVAKDKVISKYVITWIFILKYKYMNIIWDTQNYWLIIYIYITWLPDHFSQIIEKVFNVNLVTGTNVKLDVYNILAISHAKQQRGSFDPKVYIKMSRWLYIMNLHAW